MCGLAVQASESSTPPLPPPGKLFDVGGWRPHLNCSGTRRAQTPLVILEPGIGSISVEWRLLQPQGAKAARICSYDREGDGWSEMGPHPRTVKQMVYELQTLLERARVSSPPYVLVGQPYGGWPVRTYRTTYPSEVGPVPGRCHANDAPRNLLPADAKKMRTWPLGNRTYRGGVNSCQPLRTSRTDAVPGLGAVMPRSGGPPDQCDRSSSVTISSIGVLPAFSSL
jgi:hypothetical protein